MKRIVLISCVKRKKRHPARAKDLYDSALFKAMLAYARKLAPDKIFILSAKYGLLELDDVIAPYELTLNAMPIAEVKAWASRVLDQLRAQADLGCDHFIFLASVKYRRFLAEHMASFEVPMAGLGIGRQLRYLKQQVTQ